MTCRHIYDRMKAEALVLVADADEGSLEEVMARVNTWLAALRERGVHLGVAVGDGPHLCATCGTPMPCKPVRALSRSSW